MNLTLELIKYHHNFSSILNPNIISYYIDEAGIVVSSSNAALKNFNLIEGSHFNSSNCLINEAEYEIESKKINFTESCLSLEVWLDTTPKVLSKKEVLSGHTKVILALYQILTILFWFLTRLVR